MPLPALVHRVGRFRIRRRYGTRISITPAPRSTKIESGFYTIKSRCRVCSVALAERKSDIEAVFIGHTCALVFRNGACVILGLTGSAKRHLSSKSPGHLDLAVLGTLSQVVNKSRVDFKGFHTGWSSSVGSILPQLPSEFIFT